MCIIPGTCTSGLERSAGSARSTSAGELSVRLQSPSMRLSGTSRYYRESLNVLRRDTPIESVHGTPSICQGFHSTGFSRRTVVLAQPRLWYGAVTRTANMSPPPIGSGASCPKALLGDPMPSRKEAVETRG